jgi:hypothetical protein
VEGRLWPLDGLLFGGIRNHVCRYPPGKGFRKIAADVSLTTPPFPENVILGNLPAGLSFIVPNQFTKK